MIEMIGHVGRYWRKTRGAARKGRDKSEESSGKISPVCLSHCARRERVVRGDDQPRTLGVCCVELRAQPLALRTSHAAVPTLHAWRV